MDIASHVAAALGVDVVAATRVHGGDVAASFALDLADGRRVFAKTHPAAPAGFFTTEATGLRWLRDPGVVAVPEVLAASDDPPLLVLEWIEEGRPTAATEAELGLALAALHRAGAAVFGREDRRTTGSRGLPNEPCADWATFYATQRLAPLARLARDADALPERAIAGLDRLDVDRLRTIGGQPEPPARLHGDLWAGNRLVDASGRSWLIDPASHGGHREYDLGMMRLFGGFGADCFAAYARAHPLAEGWEQRVALHQISPLVVHAIKFGGGYCSAAADAIARYA
ncbi:MAG TPA: fructosamine kinase family protein [Acidimicrobiales bacterium]|nr:fructosamine kinase family protein [Acidimicrobiales bacterium]